MNTERLRREPDFVAFMQTVTTAIDELDSTRSIPDEWDDRSKAIEVAARNHAIETIEKLFEPFLFQVEEHVMHNASKKHGLD